MRAKVLFFIFLLNSNITFSQNTIDLESIIEKFIYNTDEYKNLEKQFKIQSYEYIITNNSFLPKVNLDANIPTYDHSITVITQPNGEDRFIDRKQANSTLVFDINQPITFTGGYLNIKSSVNRIDLITSKNTNYSSNWFNATLIQPLNGFNQFKWIKKINESKFKSNRIEFKRNVEQLRTDLIDKYFDLLILEYKNKLTKKNISLKEKKLIYINELLNSKKILTSEQLQENLSLNQLKINLEEQKSEFNAKYQDFKNIIEVNDSMRFLVPNIIKLENINQDLLKKRIIEFGVNQLFDTKNIITDRDFIKAKRERGIQTNLQLAYGLNSSANEINNLYQIPSKKEFFNFKISVPILNWNENKRKMLIAKEQKELLNNEYKIAIQDIDVKVSQILSYLKSLSNQRELLKQNKEFTEKNIEIATNLYLSGRITANEFDYEIFKETTTTVDYLNNLKANWINLFNLRRLALYDYSLEKDLAK